MGLLLKDRVDFRFFSASINEPLSPVDGEGSLGDFSFAANSFDGFNRTRAVLPAAVPINFLRVTFDIGSPLVWVNDLANLF